MLRNDQGETRYCYMVHSSGLDRIPAAEQYNRCLNEAGALGFRRVN